MRPHAAILLVVALTLGPASSGTGPAPRAFPPAPWAIAHRGASGVLPEHTLGAYDLAIDSGADFIECDAVLTSDCALLCRHDAVLDTTTDAAAVLGAALSKTHVIDGAPSTGVHAADVTLAQARSLRARQRRPARGTGADGVWGVVTLDEFLTVARRGAARRGAPVGVHVEAKHPSWHAAVLPHCASDAAAVVARVAADLARGGFPGAARVGAPAWRAAPVFLQCFEPDALETAAKRATAPLPPLVALLDRPDAAVPGARANTTRARDLTTPAGLRRLASFAAAIGPAVDDVLAPSSTLAAAAAAAGLALHPYTLRDDGVRAPFGGDARAEADAVVGVDGVQAVFGDYPVTIVGAVRAARGGKGVSAS